MGTRSQPRCKTRVHRCTRCTCAPHSAVLHPLACRAGHARHGRHACTASPRSLHPLCRTRLLSNKTDRARPTRDAAHVTRGRQAGRGCPAPAGSAGAPLAAPHPPATLHRIHWSARAGLRACVPAHGEQAQATISSKLPWPDPPSLTEPLGPAPAAARRRPQALDSGRRAVRWCALRAERASYFLYHLGNRSSAPRVRMFARMDRPCPCYFGRPGAAPMPACMQAPRAGGTQRRP